MDLRIFESRDKSDSQKIIDNHVDETIVDSHSPGHYQTEEKPEENEEKIVTIVKNVKVEKIQHVPIIRHVPYELKIQLPPIPQPYLIGMYQVLYSNIKRLFTRIIIIDAFFPTQDLRNFFSMLHLMRVWKIEQRKN